MAGAPDGRTHAEARGAGSGPSRTSRLTWQTVDEDGNGLLGDGRLYQLVRQHDTVRERTLQITFLEAGAEACSFTFG